MTGKIAFIGLGAMGQPMAANILKSGTPLTVYDIEPERMTPLHNLGAAFADSVEDAARGADIVVTMLPNTPQVDEVVLQPGGVLEAVSEGALLMDMSTIAPLGTDKVAAACAEKGVAFIDAPVGRLVSHAIAGESLFMIGCDEDAHFERVKPLLEAMGAVIHRCGPVGAGIRTKVVNNFLILCITQVNAEALTLAQKLGLDIAMLKEVNAGTTGTNGQLHVNFATKVLTGDTEPGFKIDLAFKDMGLALEAAGDFRVGLPVGAAAHAVYGAARAGDYAAKDFSALLDYACELAGVDKVRL